MAPTKACPIVLRASADEVQILVFEHPLAGVQLVKGTIELGERADEAALRELREESGIENAACVKDLGVWDAGYDGQIWSFWLCDSRAKLPDTWTHATPDDGGRLFRFFWHPVMNQTVSEWHVVHQAAFLFVRAALPNPAFQRTASPPLN